MEVDGVAADVGLEDGADGAAGSADVPNTDCIIPTAGDDVVRIFRVEFAAEDTVAVAGGT